MFHSPVTGERLQADTTSAVILGELSRCFTRSGGERRAVIRHGPDSEFRSSVGSLGGRLAVYLYRSRQGISIQSPSLGSVLLEIGNTRHDQSWTLSLPTSSFRCSSCSWWGVYDGAKVLSVLGRATLPLRGGNRVGGG
eukprot:2311785-Rhodomonas_salina.2